MSSSAVRPDRKTKILLVILMLYMGYLIPLGVVVLMMAIFGQPFKNNVFDAVWCVFCSFLLLFFPNISPHVFPQMNRCIFDMLALVNSGINFILLVSMSSLFREKFSTIFRLSRIQFRTAGSDASTSLTYSSEGRQAKAVNRQRIRV